MTDFINNSQHGTENMIEMKVEEILRFATEAATTTNESFQQGSTDHGASIQDLETRRETKMTSLQESLVDAQQRANQEKQRREEAEQRAKTAERQRDTLLQSVAEAQRRKEEEEPYWTVQRNEIELTSQVGTGTWGEVKIAKFRGSRVAAKCFKHLIISDYNRLLYFREINMIACLRHPNLVQFIGASPEGDLIILTELMTISLKAVLEHGPIDQTQITTISLDVARACLLYTSPSPRDATLSRMPSSA